MIRKHFQTFYVGHSRNMGKYNVLHIILSVSRLLRLTVSESVRGKTWER